MNSLKEYFELETRIMNGLVLERAESVIQVLDRARGEGRRVFLFGNGGSAATASHFACDLGKGTIQENRPRFKVIALNDNIPTLTAYANDVGYDSIFAEPLLSLAEQSDIAIAFSASGNSPNVVRGIETARARGLVTVGFTGFSGGKLKDLAEMNVHVPSDSFGIVEDLHLALTHAICEMLKIKHE